MYFAIITVSTNIIINIIIVVRRQASKFLSFHEIHLLFPYSNIEHFNTEVQVHN